MIKINDVEILTVLDGMTWAGSKDQGPRSLNFNILYKPQNDDIPKYSVSVGDVVVWEEADKILFQGYIETLEYNTDDDKISVSCKDLIARLMRSKCIKRFKGTLNKIADEICNIFGIENGINVDNTQVFNIISTGDLTYYEVLNKVCKTMFSRFNLYMDGQILKLAEHDTKATFEIGKNIRSSSFNRDMSSLVNKVLIIGENGQVLKSVEDKTLISKYGLFQDTYNFNKKIKNNIQEAQNLITNSIKNEAYIIVNNNNNCISGNFIKVIEPINNYTGTFEILEDSHIINADSSMTLKIQEVR